ncbi:MAG: hypothetical protein ACXVA9_00610, partial [Bdellovibrionales bacterium]
KQTVTLRFAKGTNIRDIASARKQLAEVPVFLWQPVRGAKSYSLQISWNAEFTRLLTEENVPSSSYEWRLAVPGKFFWRVRANNDLGNSGPYSAHGTAEVNLQEPVLGSVYTFTEKGSLEWDAVPLAEKYIVETSLDRSMASAAAKQTEEPQIPLELGPQPTYVRIAAANSAGERVSGFSQIATVTFETPLRLAAPGLITPPKGAKVTLPKSGRISIVFSWNPVEHASNYYVEISKYPNFSKTIQKKAVHSNKWVLKGAKFEGKVYWRVRTEGRGGPSPWSHSGFFEVR